MLTTILSAAVALAPASHAATYQSELGLEELSDQADRIVIADVVSTYTTKRHGVVYTVADLAVTQTLKGDHGWKVRVTVPGGKLDGAETRVPGAPRFIESDTMLLYLEDETIVGLGQGSFVVEYGLAWRPKRDDVFLSPRRQHDWADQIDPNEHYTVFPLQAVRNAAR
ncbi:MAG: hypothetical protein VX265_12095 [Myxococcota bacterium]|nr:hypothetical protein [Myxococcota bacterium]